MRRGLRLKSVPTTFRQLEEMPGGRCRTNQPKKFTLTRTVSSGPKLAAFEFKKWHVLIMKSNKYNAVYRIDENGSDGFKENSAELKTSRLTSVATFLIRNLV